MQIHVRIWKKCANGVYVVVSFICLDPWLIAIIAGIEHTVSCWQIWLDYSLLIAKTDVFK